MKNPKWHRDELILALNLYFKLEPGQIHAKNQQIIDLSILLNKLPIHQIKPNQKTFRNPNGVGLKLSNFLAIDPSYSGKGMDAYSKLDYEVFNQFVNNKEELKSLAKKVQKTVLNENLNIELYNIENVDDNETFSVREGVVIYKLHKYRERDSSINKKKKSIVFKEKGKLECEVCGFDYYSFYGEIGKEFIECHHIIPLSHIDSEVITTLEDLALVCSNCHQMLHRGINTLTVDELKKYIIKSKSI
jgi:5-methylcytosine-specific restriction protein A